MSVRLKAVSKRFKGLVRGNVSGLALCSKKVGDLMFGENDVDPFWNSADAPQEAQKAYREQRTGAGADGTIQRLLAAGTPTVPHA